MGVENFLVASSLIAILAQRLVRQVCPDCRVAYQPSDEELQEIGISGGRAELKERYGADHIYKAAGCPACNRSGYRGRTGIYEYMPVDDDIRQLVLKNVDSNTIKKTAVAKGMATLLADGAQKVARGETTIAEVLSVTQEDT
jgi:general secretion pathway protein E